MYSILLWRFLLAFFLCHAIFGYDEVQAASDDDFYTAGVVEFRPVIFNMTSTDILAEHLESYIEILRSTAANATDIVVFPEGTLNSVFTQTFVPDARDGIIPCLQANVVYSDFLVKLSCTARDVRKYVVINLTEKENCSSSDPRPCAANGLNVFNTNVVFDREGRVVSRYRKWHIYLEVGNTTLEPEFATFDTDFGVRFGHFICFDILFYTPAEELVVRHGIHDFIFPSFFYSELPFLTAAQLQQSWAWGNNVNLLAAGASSPKYGVTGSGIYAGAQGHLVSVMAGGDGERQLYVARVPKWNSSTTTPNGLTIAQTVEVPQTDIALMKDTQIENFKSELLNFTTQPNVTRRLCDGKFCCDFKVLTKAAELPAANEISNSSAYQYRIGIFNGRRTYEKEEWSDVQICALYACTDVSADSCGEIFNASVNMLRSVVFHSIEIRGEFEKAQQLLIMPNSLNDRLHSLNADAVQWHKNEQSKYYEVHYELTAEADDLLTFGIYANYYIKSMAPSQHILLVVWMIFGSGVVLTRYFVRFHF